MTTHIIRLDAADDVASAGDKLALGQPGRIVLVWPERGRPLASRVELTLLQRRARALGVQVAFAARDREIRALASDLGIPVFRKVADAQSRPWRSGRRKNPPLHTPRGIHGLHAIDPRKDRPKRTIFDTLPLRLTTFGLAVLAVLSLAGFLLPSAEIEIQAPRMEQKVRWQGIAVPESQTADGVTVLPMRQIELVVEESGARATTSLVRYPVQTATGTVRFTNLTAEPVDIPLGTIVASTTEPVQRFETTAAGQAPAGVGKTVDLSIRAIDPGEQGNLAIGAIQSIQGALGLVLTVGNPLSTSGGSEKVYPAPGDTDRAQLKASLIDALRKAALDQALRQLPSGSALIDSSLSAGEVIADESFPSGRQPSDRLEESLRARFTVDYLAAADLQKAATAALDTALPAGYRAMSTDVQVKLTRSPVAGPDGRVQWQIDAARPIEPALAVDQIADQVRGMPGGLAAAWLETTYRLASSPAIRVSPQGWPWLPFLPMRITVIEGKPL
jgi:hypothetical protein